MYIHESGTIQTFPKPTGVGWRKATQEEIEAASGANSSQVRELRNQKLRETDWMVLPDAPITEDVKQQVLIYRQALRDIPNQAAFPTDVVWPTITW